MVSAVLLLVLACAGKDTGDNSDSLSVDTEESEAAGEDTDTGAVGVGDTGPTDVEDTGPIDFDGDGYDESLDCDDANASVNPDADEVCDDIDNNCDGIVDERCPGDLANADAQFLGEAGGDYAGIAVSNAGDVNNDNYDDLIIGAFGEDSGGNASGATYLVLGPATGRINLSDADAKFIGEPTNNSPSGAVLSSAGDVNNDGYDDLVMGVGGVHAIGAAYLMLGPVTGVIHLADADAKLLGEELSSSTGSSVSSAGDVNNDDYDDLIIGAPGESTLGRSSGAAYLVLGSVTGEIDLADADAKFLAEASGDSAGSSVSGAGDMNNDGYDDFIIGATGDSSVGSGSGAAYLVLGPVTGESNLADADTKFLGETAGDHAGTSVSHAGDVNNDGYSDLILGVYFESTVGVRAGAAYLVLGPVTGEISLADADAKFLGEVSYDYAGHSVSGAGDVNNDDHDDLIIGAYGDRTVGSNSGAAYLILGPVTGQSSLADADIKFRGEATNDYAGAAVSGAGDVNNDGYGDLIVGAYGYDSLDRNAGAAYLLLGGTF